MTEEDILQKVYKKEYLEGNYEKSETPDFIITDPTNKIRFGVEITTLYNSQASAIMRHDNFNDNFIDNNKPDSLRNKKKKMPKYLRQLKVAKVEGDSKFVHKEHVIWFISNTSDFFDFFENIIKKKNDSYDTLDNLEFVNLIAMDEDNFVKHNKIEPGAIYGYLRKHSLFETIISSNFQEIFLISEFHSGLYNIPLKWYVFKNEYELFKKFWNEKINISQNQRDNIDLMLKNFCVCLIHLGFKGVYFFYDKSGNKYIVFGNTYWKINLKKKTINEKYFIGKGLEKKTEMRAILTNHEKYDNIFGQYMNYRNTIVPKFENDVFIHLS